MAAVIFHYLNLLSDRLFRPLQLIKPVLQLIKVKFLLIILLLLELTAAFFSLPKPTLVKNKLAAWPYSNSAQKDAESIMFKPATLMKEIATWESRMQSGIRTKNIYLYLALLYYQVYDDKNAKTYWQQALYLDPQTAGTLSLFP